jgi:hypothetical protein
MSEKTPPQFVGVAVYRVNSDGTLNAVWTTSDSLGQGLGTERLSGGIPGQLPGTYALQIFDNQARLILEGTTTIAQRGPAYALRWDGNDGSVYEGMGLLQDGAVLAVTYYLPGLV